MVGGDFNFPVDNLHKAPKWVLALRLARRLVDTDSKLVAAGQVPLCLHLGPGMERPSRIDGQLVDTCVASLLLKAWPIPSGGSLGHRPVCFDLLPHRAGQGSGC